MTKLIFIVEEDVDGGYSECPWGVDLYSGRHYR